MYVPCEDVVWDVLPKIRATLAWYMVKEYGLKGHEVSQKLGVSDAAVSQYMTGKRGAVIQDQTIVALVREVIERNLQTKGEIPGQDICKICIAYRKGHING